MCDDSLCLEKGANCRVKFRIGVRVRLGLGVAVGVEVRFRVGVRYGGWLERYLAG